MRAVSVILIFLFCFEAVASLGAHCLLGQANASAVRTVQIECEHSISDFQGQILFEETVSEELTSRIHCQPVQLFEIFSHLKQFEKSRVNWSQPEDKASGQPDIITRHRVRLI